MNTFVLALAFVALAILVWKLWKPVVAPPKQEVPVNEARLYMFYTEWCGFSQKALPEWNKLEKKLSGNGYFGKVHVNPIKVDADKEKELSNLYNVSGYPTVILETHEGSYDFKKRVTYDNLVSFLRTNLGKESESL